MIDDIKELDDLAHRMGVMWDKANNFYVSFAGDLLKVSEALQSSRYGNDWTLAKWLFVKAGMFEKPIMMILKAHQNAIAEEDREKLEMIERDRKHAVRAAKEEARIAAAKATAIKTVEREVARIAAETAAAEKAEADRVAKEARDKAERDSQKEKGKERKRVRDRDYRKRRNAATAKARASAAVLATAENPRLNALLSECYQLERLTRVELGRRYAEMQEIVNNRRAGLNRMTNKPWFWGAWCEAHIKRSRQDVGKCIKDFLSHSCDKTSDNVVHFVVGGER